MNIVNYNYNGTEISFMPGDDVMVNATQMAKPFGKRTNDWLILKQTNELIVSLSAKTGIPATGLVTVNQGGNNQGTWLYEDLALIFAQWLSPKFYLWCNDRIKELLKYGVTATQPTIDRILDDPDILIQLATQLKTERQKASTLEDKIKIDEPKVKYYNTVLRSINTYSTTQIAKEYGMSAIALNQKLKELGVQYKLHGQWVLTSKYQDKGYAKTITYSFLHSDNTPGTSLITTWTESGRYFIHTLLKSNN